MVEMLVVAALFTIVGATMLAIYLFSARGFSSLANYADLDKINRKAMDTLTAEIRQAKAVTSKTDSSISLITEDGQAISYNFNSESKQLVRFNTTTGETKVMLGDCNLLQFDTYQRNPVATTFDQYSETNNVNEIKVIMFTWKASRPILGSVQVSENIQTAKVVMRNQNYYSLTH